jgi:ubiquitin-protein ligase E3 A
MFTYNTETRNYWFNNNSTDFLEYQLIGNLLALAIYNGVILDVHFPHLVYKKLAGIKPGLEDLKQVNPVRILFYFPLTW